MNDWVEPGAVGTVFAYFGGYQFPEQAPLAVSGLAIAGVGALFATGKANDLLPGPSWMHLVQVDASNDDLLACWSLSPDKLVEMQVEWGPLYPHEQAHDNVHERYTCDPSSSAVVGTRRRSLPGSLLIGRHDIDDVLDVVGELRGDPEPMARRGQEPEQAFPAIIRRTKHDTMEIQDAALGPSASTITDQPTVDEIITSELPEEFRPGRLQNGGLRDLLKTAGDRDDNRGDWDDGLGTVLNNDLTDGALESVPTSPSANNDGD